MAENAPWFRRLCLAGGVLIVALVALLPWWRHHAYLRDFYDYGLVMSGVGRIAGGERPYVDFVTPIQTGTFLFNGWAEKAGGGTFQGMTLGGAALIVLAAIGLAYLFARRWPAWLAVLAAGALVAMSASQHTIVWHNSIGALCVVAVAWMAALAPVARGRQWAWGAAIATLLFVGGINKLNAQLVALAVAAAWALRAAARGEATVGRTAATLALWILAGVVAPVAFELAWTRAPFAVWWHNVVALPFSSRAGDFGQALHAKFYLETHHNYYGALSVPWHGAVGVAVTFWFGVVAWRAARGWSERFWASAAAVFAFGAGAGLLATNYEIAWVAMAAWLGLIGALWVGFALPARGAAFVLGIVLPAGVLGVAGWESAWRGQRSQFGYSTAPRSEYRDGGAVHEEFAYLRGTRLPPSIAATMNEARIMRSRVPALLRGKIFYGPGLEWLERPWPTMHVRGLPLWMHAGTSYGPSEEKLLLDALRPDGVFDTILVSEVRDHWTEETRELLRTGYRKARLGPDWFLYRGVPAGTVSVDPLGFLSEFGGNVDSSLLRSTMKPLTQSDGRKFLGTSAGLGTLTLQAACYRVQVEAVIRRRDPQAAGPVRLRFGAFAMIGDELHERGTFDAELPAGEGEKVFVHVIDPGGVPMLFTVNVPPEWAGRIEAGWRAPRSLHTVDGPDEPPHLSAATRPVELAEAGMRLALLPEKAQGMTVFVRAPVGTDANGFVLSPGGEVWLRLRGGFPAITLTAQAAGPLNPAAQPVLRVFYYKGGRLEVLSQEAVHSAEPINLRAWSAEADGWIGVLLDPSEVVPSLRLRFSGL